MLLGAQLVSLGGLILELSALLLHLALTMAAAPVVDALIDEVDRRRSGRVPIRRPRRPRSSADMATAVRDAVGRPWRRLAWLMAKEPVLADKASAVSGLSPVVAVAVTVAAATLVPSFCLGMPTASAADLPTILALLGLARLTLLLGALDVGSAVPGLAAISVSAGAVLALPGLVLSLATLWLGFGSTSLDAILSELRGGAGVAGRSVPELLAALSLGLAALSAGGAEDDLSRELAGPDLALFRLQAALQRLVWIELVTALLLPGSLAPTLSNPLRWLLGLLSWTVRVAAGCLLLGALRGWLRVPRARRELAGISALFGLLAPLLLLVGRGAE